MLNALLLVPALFGATLSVGPKQDYATIKDALSEAASDDIISIFPGTYQEDLWYCGGATIEAAEGLGTVFIDGSQANSEAVTLACGATARDLILQDAAEDGFSVGSSTSIERCIVENSSGSGVVVLGSSPTFTEVAVYNAGEHSFLNDAGTNPKFYRCLSVDPADTGFHLAAPGQYYNLVSFGGQRGFVLASEGIELSHAAAIDASESGVQATATASIVNSLLYGSPLAMDCGGNALQVSNSLLWEQSDTGDCKAAKLADIFVQDPALSIYEPGARPPLVDLRPEKSSPLIDGGSGSDAADKSVADIGIFGGEYGVWTDDDKDGLPIHFDCDDGDYRAYAGAAELLDKVDNDCNGAVDDINPQDTGDTGDTGADTGDTGQADETDIDGDGWSVSAGDCEDHNLATWPGASEIADGADNDCDGAIDNDTWLYDDDGDGYTETGGDCDDPDPTRHPGADDSDADGVDDDCDGRDDASDEAQDADGDGFTIGQGDCDDTNANQNPDAWDGLNGVDDDCDGETDGDMLHSDSDRDGVTPLDGDCNDFDISIATGLPEAADDGIDQDCDGVDLYDVDQDGHPTPEAGGGDCDDAEPEIHPDATEICDGLDNDCDERVDEYCGAEDLDGPELEARGPVINAWCNCSGSARGGVDLAALLLAASCWLARRRRSSALPAQEPSG